MVATMKPTRQRVFVASLADVCEIHPTILPEWRSDLADLVTECSNLDWLFLTKRPENFNDLYLDLFGGKLPDNLWVGTSVESQAYADQRIPELIKIDAKVRFLSCEPLLQSIDLSVWLDACSYACDHSGVYPEGHRPKRSEIHWVIVGGESGSKARPMHPKWALSLRDQCQEAEVAYHFKQWGEWLPASQSNVDAMNGQLIQAAKEVFGGNTNKRHEWDEEHRAHKVGKHAAGRLLDGRTWDQYPE
jgi:protein gp37